MTTTQSFLVGDYVVPHPPGKVTSVGGKVLQPGEALVRRIRDVGVKQQILLTCIGGELEWFEGENFRRVPAS